MNIFLRACIVFASSLIVLLAASTAWAQDGPRPQRVLLLHSYQKGVPWDDLVSLGIRTVLTSDPKIRVQINEEHLDLARYPGEAHLDLINQTLRLKYGNPPVDLVIGTGVESSRYLLAHGQAGLPGTPMVILDREEEAILRPALPPHMTSLLAGEDAGGTLEAALGLLPQTRQVYVVAGSAIADRKLMEKARTQLAPYAGRLTISYLEGTTAADLLRKVASLPSHSVIIFLNYLRDGAGQNFIPRQFLERLSAMANVPVFGVYDTHFGHGMVGGFLNSAEFLGQGAARLSLRILDGENPATIDPARLPDTYMFDWRQLKRWKLTDRPLPPDSQVRFREYSFWELYWGWILAASCVLALQMVLIGLLLVQRRQRTINEEQRRRAMEALSESEQRYRQIFETGQVVKLVIAPQDGAIVDANQAACNYYGYSLSELTSKSIFDLNPLPREQVSAAMGRVLEGRAKTLQFKHLLSTGEVREVEVFPSPLTLHGRRLIHSIVFDITQRKRAEEALKESEKRFRATFEQISVGMVHSSLEGKFQMVNQRLADFLGYQPEEMVGMSFLEITFSEDREGDAERIKLLLRGEIPRHGREKRYMRKDGKEVWGNLSVSLVRDDRGQPSYFVAVVEDITHRRLLEAQLRQAQKMEALGTLAGGIAHDFNNILNAVLGFAELAKDDALAGRANPADLDEIIHSTERAKGLVQQILAFSRKSEPRLRPLDLKESLDATLKILRRTLPKMIEIQAHLTENLPPVLADPTQMEQVLLNMASNAQDVMPEGGKLVVETALVELDKDYCRWALNMTPGPYVRLIVSDTGQGMDKETSEHIFEPFYTTKAIGKGTGLGLSSVYGIIRSHGGHIHCYSEVGRGTSFHVYLPVHLDDSPLPRPEPAPVDDQALSGSETILFVDDEEVLLTLGERILADYGYRPLTAPSGEKALDIYRNQGDQVDLVIMDLGMPGMGGRRALKAILEMNPEAKVIIASGYSVDGLIKSTQELGARDYLSKPFSRLDLLRVARRVLDADS